MTEFNAKAARIKRPLPFWVDAFQRDTQDLSTEEIGAYMLLLSAMWSRESCDLPDDDKRLARVCRVTESKWKRGLGCVMRGFLVAESGVVFSKRLRREAAYVEHSVKEQSDRKKGKSPSKPLKDNDATQSTDDPQNIPGESPEQPTQQPNNPTIKIEEDKSSSIPKKSRGTRLSEDWFLPLDWGDYSLDQGMSHNEIRIEAEKFKNYWISKSGKDASKVSWEATWKNWTLNFIQRRGSSNVKQPYHHQQNGHPQGQQDRLDPALENINRFIRNRHARSDGSS